jgi:hypothetical protein
MRKARDVRSIGELRVRGIERGLWRALFVDVDRKVKKECRG